MTWQSAPRERGEIPERERREIFTVSELAFRVKRVLDKAFPPLWTLGEVSNLRQPSSGHIYFTLKDARAILDVVMFRMNAERGLVAPLADGQEVLVHGRLSSYPSGSRVQIIADRVEPHGKGALELERARLLKRYQRAGLFEPSRKRPLPRFPRHVGIITSPTGAAVRDILSTLGRRWPRLRITLAGVRVQGEGAARQVARGLDVLNAMAEPPDVIIVSRGGGSVEDLWPFNLEPIVEGIGRSAIPVVTGIGHETDETLADFAADLRVATPTAAAEAVVPVAAELDEQLRSSALRFDHALRAQVGRARERLGAVTARLTPRLLQDRVGDHARKLDELSERLDWALRQPLRERQARLNALSAARFDAALGARLRAARARLERVTPERMSSALETAMRRRKERLAGAAARLEALSPHKVLGRGYAIARRQGRILQDASEAKLGDEIELRLRHGSLRAVVRKIETEDAE